MSARSLAGFRDFDGIDGRAAGDIAAIDQPFAVGGEMLVGFERIVMACEIDEPFRLQRAGGDQRVAGQRVARAGIVVGAGVEEADIFAVIGAVAREAAAVGR